MYRPIALGSHVAACYLALASRFVTRSRTCALRKKLVAVVSGTIFYGTAAQNMFTNDAICLFVELFYMHMFHTWFLNIFTNYAISKFLNMHIAWAQILFTKYVS